MRRWIGNLAVITLATLAAAPVAAQPETPAPRDLSTVKPSEVGLPVKEHLGAPLPMELEFTNAEGERHRLGEYFTHDDGKGGQVKGKPAIIALVYYRCPVICSTLLSTITDCVRDIQGLSAGTDYNVLTFSFDPQDDKFAAARRKEALLDAYGRKENPATPGAWQFFLHEEGSTRQLANALGFQYRKIESSGDFAHPVVFFLATPDGRIARYVYGFGHTALQMRLSLLEAGEGTITQSLKDQFLTFCYMYDPKVGRYTLSAVRVMQAGGVATMVGLGGLVGVLLIGERLRARRAGRVGKAVGAVGGGAGVVGVAAEGSPAGSPGVNR